MRSSAEESSRRNPPRVIETTHKFKDYYGVELDNEECKCFLLQNVLPMVKTVIEKINATETADPRTAAIG